MSICKKKSVCVLVVWKKVYVRERDKEKVHTPHNYWAGVLAIALVLCLHSACRYESLPVHSRTLSSCPSTSPHPARTHGFAKVPLNVIYSPAIITHSHLLCSEVKYEISYHYQKQTQLQEYLYAIIMDSFKWLKNIYTV